MDKKVIGIIIVLVAIAAFLGGATFTQYQQKGAGPKAGVTPSPTAQQPMEQPTVLGEEQIAKLSATGHTMGKENAKITMIEFSDFQCPYCARYVTETFPQIEREYIETGKVLYIFHHYPLPFHQYAQKAAEAAECAGEQGKFWEMHDKLFADQEKLTEADLKTYAANLGLNTSQFNTCLSSGQFQDEVQADMELGQSMGVNGTPSFFVNGKFVSGAQPFASFKQIIDAELNQ